MIKSIDSIDAMLAMVKEMTPEQLKQFAIRHSGDIVAMSAVSKVQSERDRARPPPAMPTSTVVDQLAESISPSDTGIAALPANNMTYAAEGGIVGYAGDGPQGQLVRPMYPGMIAQEGEGLLPSKTGYEGMGILEFIQKFGMDAYNKLKNAIPGESTEERLARQRREVYEASQKGRQERALAELSKPEPIDAMKLPPRPADPRWAADTRVEDGRKPPEQDRSQGAPRPAPPRASAPTAGAVAAAPQDLAALYKQAQKMANVGDTTDPDAAARAEILASRQAQAQREQADAEQRAAGLQSLLKPREERIARREAALEKQGDIDRSMAIINAGLAMMQSTGQGLSGIAEGAAKGFKQYGESMALSKAERQKIDDARDAYDELKFNAQNLSQKDITAAKNKIAEAANISKESGMAAVQKQREVSAKTAEAIFKEAVGSQTSAMDRASREKVAGMQIAAAGARAGANEPKQRLAELKSMQTNLLGQLKTTMPYGATKADYLRLQAELAEVNRNIAKMAGLDTMAPSPGAAKAPAQNRAPLESFYK